MRHALKTCTRNYRLALIFNKNPHIKTTETLTLGVLSSTSTPVSMADSHTLARGTVRHEYIKRPCAFLSRPEKSRPTIDSRRPAGVDRRHHLRTSAADYRSLVGTRQPQTQRVAGMVNLPANDLDECPPHSARPHSVLTTSKSDCPGDKSIQNLYVPPEGRQARLMPHRQQRIGISSETPSARPESPKRPHHPLLQPNERHR